MEELERLLGLRKKLKAKMPNFLAQDAHKKKRIKKRWNKPRGSDSKMRVRRRGYNRLVSVGYGSPKQVKYLHSSGLKMVNVSNAGQLSNLNKESEAIIITSTVGLKKRIEIAKKANEIGIRIINIKNANEWLKQVDELLNKKKQEKVKTAKVKEEKVKEREKVAQEKKEKEEKGELADKIENEEDKKELEKQEKDKIITKKV